MANIISTLAALAANALLKGPLFGQSGFLAQRPMMLLEDKAVASGTVTSAQKIQFGVLPAGSKIVPHLSWITSGHSATIAGKIVLRPTDGSAVTEITGVTVTRDDANSPGKAFLSTADTPVITKPSYVEFVPTSDTTFSGNVDVRARIVYTTNH